MDISHNGFISQWNESHFGKMLFILSVSFLYSWGAASLCLFLSSSNVLFIGGEKDTHFCLLLFFLDILWLFSITAYFPTYSSSIFWLVSLPVLSSFIKVSTLFFFPPPPE